MVNEYSPLFRNVYLILQKGYAIESITDIHENNELNGVKIPKYYRSETSSRKIISAIVNVMKE